LNINNINFSEVNITGKVNYIENYLKYSDNLENLFDSIYKINGKITLETTNEEKFLISFLKLFFEKLENQKNQKFAFSELINAFGNESSNFKGAINKNNNILETSNIEISNKNNRILIKGEYNYSNNFIDIILNLSQNNEIYLTTLIKGNLNNPNISFDENSKFFKNLNSNENNIIEESVIQFLNNFFDSKSPNTLRAILNTFVTKNSSFHAIDGSGYRYIAKKIIDFDKLNPIVISRFVKVFSRYNFYSEPYKNNMVETIKQIKKNKLSTNTKEVLDAIID